MKNRMFFTAGLFSILFFAAISCTAAQETSQDVKTANYLFAEAEKNYNKGNCSSATRDAADNALTLYNRANYEEGRSKAAALLQKINACIKTNADKNYDAAQKAYFENKYNQSITLALRAKADYAAIPDSQGVEKCDSLIADAARASREIMINTAKGILQEAMNLFDRGDYINCEDKAKQALQLFNVSDDQMGIQQSSQLITAVGNKKLMLRANADDLRRQAGEMLRKAKNDQLFTEFSDAKDLAKQAQAIYRQIKEVQGYKDCSDIMADCDAQMENLEEKQRQKADDKYADCRSDLLSGNGETDEAKKTVYYANATTKCQVAMTLYTNLWGWARDTFNTKKEEFYQGEINKCKQKIAEIVKAQQDRSTKTRADDLYRQAYAFYTDGECANASLAAAEAKALYEKIGDSGVYKTISLIDEVTICLNKITQAEGYLSAMRVYYRNADYPNATITLQKAEKLYTEVNNKEGMNKCTNYKQKIINSMQKKKEADGLVAQGVIDLNQNKFEDAKNKAMEANKTYQSINYVKGIAVSSSLLLNISTAKKNAEDDQWKNMMIIVGAIVLGIVMVVALWFLRSAERNKTERDRIARERKRLEEEDARRRAAEKMKEDLRMKELEMERTKLKSMVAEEMRRMEADKRRSL